MSEQIGRYRVIETIGKGGMGEVLLADDPVCKRQVALKRTRGDLKRKEQLKKRFLHEAKITAGLTHPGVISIYSIHHEDDELYYTMPYVEGETLKQIIRREINKPDTGESIPALLPIFKSVCQTVAYAHSKGILHRDIKPENILVGKYGEVVILDWGLALHIGEKEEVSEPNKLAGTVTYMAPERASGAPSSIQTDIYALGVMLYLILTLHLPFKRPSIKEFRQKQAFEKLMNPIERAPYREVPPRLARIVQKALEADPEKRYQSVEELIHDILGHMEGRSEWFESACLRLTHKGHWEFQENVLLAKHIAVTRAAEASGWVSVMVSKEAFAENTRFETRVRIGENSAGIGFLLCVPEAEERESPLEGYCLWLGVEGKGSVQLFRNTVEVIRIDELAIETGQWHTITVDKIDNNIHLGIDGVRCFTYLSYLPLFGTHIGLLSRDADFEMEAINVFVGSQRLTVSCLSIPDAFLASKDYSRALAEYRRIAYSFPGHAEGREAYFRAGVTLLERARTAPTTKKRETYYTLALEEFAKLHTTSGAPLEYLGKALVYQSLRDHSEEIKCLELGLRRYYNHPLVSVLREQIAYRMHEAAQTDRRSAYQLILIVLRLLPTVVQSEDAQRLFHHLVSNWEPLYFFESSVDPSLLPKETATQLRFAGVLAFWMGAPYILQETFHTLIKQTPFDLNTAGDLIYSLFILGSYSLAHKLMDELASLELEDKEDLHHLISRLEPIYIAHSDSLQKAQQMIDYTEMGVRELRTLSYLLQFAIRTKQESLLQTLYEKVSKLTLSLEDRILIDAFGISAYLRKKEWNAVGQIFEKYPLEMLNQEGTILHPLYGCYLLATEGEEIANIHFAGVIETPFPRSWALLGHELTNKITETPSWYSTSFLWERRRLYQQLALYYCCADNSELEAYYNHLEREEYIYAAD